MWPVCFFITSGQDVTLTVGKKKMKPFISRWVTKDMRIEAGCCWGRGSMGAFSVIAHPSSNPGPCGRLWTTLASCEQMGGTQWGNMSCPVVTFKGRGHLLCSTLSLNSPKKTPKNCWRWKGDFHRTKNAANNILAVVWSYSGLEFHNSDQVKVKVREFW